MFDIGMSELLVIGTVALIVIGPKDLPELFRSLGRMTAKVRAMSREFSRAMEAAANESGVKDVADDLRRATSAKSMGLDAVKDAATKFENWDPLKAARSTAKPTPKPGPAEATVSKGPATQALADAQAARKAAALNDAEKLKKPVVATAEKPTPTPTPVTAIPVQKPDAPAKKPRAPRKPKPKADV
jgi:sec-independent protein translocase protein TatB